MDKIGNRIKSIRKCLKINQYDFSKSIGISQGTLSDIENNKFNPSAKTIASIMKEYDMCANWILIGNCKYDVQNLECPFFQNLLKLNIFEKVNSL